MKILFVSTSIPPETDMHTTRNMYLIDGLLRGGHTVDVLTCGDYSSKNSMFDKVLDRVNVYRTKYPIVMRWHKYVNNHCKYKPLLKIHNVLINYYAIPDMYAYWESCAMSFIESHKLYDYDVVVSSSGSYTAHYVGRKLKNKAQMCWIAEYGDPWGLDAFGNIKKMYYQLEKPLIKESDGLVFTTQATIDIYKEKYDCDVPYKLVTGGFKSIVQDLPEMSNIPTFTYMGIAYKRDRNLSGLLDAIKKNTNARALLVGTISNDILQEYSNVKNIETRGRVLFEESLRIMASSSVMVIVGNYGVMQIPGKTYIYLSSMKPILYIQQQENNDPTLELLKKFKGVITCKNDEESIVKAVNFIIENYAFLKKEAVLRSESEMMRKYTWESLGNQFNDFVNERHNNFVKK